MITGTEKSTEIKAQYKKIIGRKVLFIFSSIILIFIIAGVAATLGSYPITVTEVYSIIWHDGIPKIIQNADFIISHGISEFFHTYFTTEEKVVWGLRLPHLLMGILAGIGLAIAGTIMQGIVRNTLASPCTSGIASAAGFGVALAIILGASFVTGKYLLIANAFIFALLSSFIIYDLSRYKGTLPETMILAGIALMYLFSAMTGVLQYLEKPRRCKRLYSGCLEAWEKPHGISHFSYLLSFPSAFHFSC